MKFNRAITLLIFGAFVLLLALAPAGQAREMTVAEWHDLNQPQETAAHAYEPAQFSGVWGTAPDLLVSCDPDGGLLASLNPGSATSAHRLNASACQKQAVIDAEQAAQALSGGSCGYRAVSGDMRMLKIAGGFTETRYVYLRCGKKVGEFGPPSCTCGNWRYAYDCKKPPTVYITLPCR